MSRHPARKGPADANQKAIAEAIELLVHPLPVMRLNTAGNGVEDLLVPLVRLSDFQDPDPLVAARRVQGRAPELRQEEPRPLHRCPKGVARADRGLAAHHGDECAERR